VNFKWFKIYKKLHVQPSFVHYPSKSDYTGLINNLGMQLTIDTHAHASDTYGLTVGSAIKLSLYFDRWSMINDFHTFYPCSARPYGVRADSICDFCWETHHHTTIARRHHTTSRRCMYVPSVYTRDGATPVFSFCQRVHNLTL
jgi:hypothetical protein